MTLLSRIALPLAAAAFFFAAAHAEAGGSTKTSEHHVYVHVVQPQDGQTANVVVSLAEEAPTAPVEEVVTSTETADQAAPSSGGSLGLLFFVFVLAIFLGFELIAKVPSQLHTPLMSGSNAISGITIVGALLAVGSGNHVVTVILGCLAVAFAMINVAGGYVVTDRMLGMFKHREGGAK